MFVTITLNSVVMFLVGATLAGGVTRAPVVDTAKMVTRRPDVHPAARIVSPLVDFADVVEHHSQAMGDLNTTKRFRDTSRRGNPPPYDRDILGRGPSSGFIIDAPVTSSPSSTLSTIRSASR